MMSSQARLIVTQTWLLLAGGILVAAVGLVMVWKLDRVVRSLAVSPRDVRGEVVGVGERVDALTKEIRDLPTREDVRKLVIEEAPRNADKPRIEKWMESIDGKLQSVLNQMDESRGIQ